MRTCTEVTLEELVREKEKYKYLASTTAVESQTMDLVLTESSNEDYEEI